MVRFRSESEIESHEAKNFFVPSGAGIVLYVLLAMIAVLALNAGNIIQHLSSNYIGPPENLKANFTTLYDGFSHSFSTALGGRLGQMMLWAFVGALAYIGLWLAKNVLNSFENDIISDHYLHPSTYSRAGYWGSSFSVKIFLAALVLITAGYVFILVTSVLPSLSALAGSAIYKYDWSSSPLYLLVAILGAALAFYITQVLLRLLAHLWKLL
jgi:hypothetical protein